MALTNKYSSLIDLRMAIETKPYGKTIMRSMQTQNDIVTINLKGY